MITVDGLLLPCCNDLHLMNYILGDLSKESFYHIWIKRTTKEIRENLLHRRALMCKFCFPDDGFIIKRLF